MASQRYMMNQGAPAFVLVHHKIRDEIMSKYSLGTCVDTHTTQRRKRTTSSPQYFFKKDGGLRFIFAFVTITVFKTKSESAWTTTNVYRRGTVNKSPG